MAKATGAKRQRLLQLTKELGFDRVVTDAAAVIRIIDAAYAEPDPEQYLRDYAANELGLSPPAVAEATSEAMAEVRTEVPAERVEPIDAPPVQEPVAVAAAADSAPAQAAATTMVVPIEIPRLDQYVSGAVRERFDQTHIVRLKLVRLTLHRLWFALTQQKRDTLLSNGRICRTREDVICWLLERVGEAAGVTVDP